MHRQGGINPCGTTSTTRNQKFIDLYTTQQETLLKEAADKEANTKNDRRNSTINNEREQDVQMTNAEYTSDGNKGDETKESATGLAHRTKNTYMKKNEVKEIKQVENLYGKKSKDLKTPKRKNEVEEDRDQTKKRIAWRNDDGEKQESSIAQRLKQSEADRDNRSDGKETSKNGKSIRIRFQFRADTKGKNGPKTNNDQIKELLYEMMMCSKSIDKNSSLKPWKKGSNLPILNGYEIKLQTGDAINEYVDIPELKENLVDGKLYYQNRLCIKTKMNVYEFTERWSNNKYSGDKNSSFRNWRPVKAAEMQKYDTA